MVGFEKMLFNLNEGLTHMGFQHRYITDFHFFMDIVVTAILMFGFNKIVVEPGVLDKYVPQFVMTVLIIIIVALIVAGIYLHLYDEVLVLTSFILIVFAIATLDIFENLREYLDEKFGWLF